jgi:RNA polymerase primary sigma factor
MDGLRDYLNEIGRWPLLTPAQEIDLARLHQAGLAVRRNLGARKPTRAERHTMRIGDRAGQRMVECNMRWVVSIAKKYTRMCRLHDLGDLIQYGALGLQHAASKFDPERGYKFSTYARDWIASHIGRGIYNEDSPIYVPERKQQQWLGLGRKAVAFAQSNGRMPTEAELLNGSDFTPEWYRQVHGVMVGAISLDMPAHEDGDTIGALIPSPAGSPEPTNDYGKLLKCVEALPEDDRGLIQKRYGFSDYHPHTLKSISEERGVSKEAVRRRILAIQQRLAVAISQPAA